MAAPDTRRWFCLTTLLIFFVLKRTFVSSSVACPSGSKCFSRFEDVTVKWGYNGYLCPGQNDGQCYNGEKDPRGFDRGPIQKPVQINLGDTLYFASSSGFTFKPFNVSRSKFYSCAFNESDAIIPSQLSKFKVPNKYINSEGVRYFIAESNGVFLCKFGLRLEVFVRNASPCLNPTVQNKTVCSQKGLCAVAGSFFNYNVSCVCQPGYEGSYCEELNSCHRSPCRNGGTCLDKKSGLTDDYECKCIVGFKGNNCEKNIDDCKDNPCKNNSVCVDAIDDYDCLCQQGYHGKNCTELRPNPCEPSPCKNGGTCSLDNNRHNYTCKCAAGFEGQNCTNNATVKSSVQLSSSVIDTSYASTLSSTVASTKAVSSVLTISSAPISSTVSSSVASSIFKPITTIIHPSTRSYLSSSLSISTTRMITHLITTQQSYFTTTVSGPSGTPPVQKSTSVVAQSTVLQSKSPVSTEMQATIHSSYTTALMKTTPLPTTTLVGTMAATRSTPSLAITTQLLETTATTAWPESIPTSYISSPMVSKTPSSISTTLQASTPTATTEAPGNTTSPFTPEVTMQSPPTTMALSHSTIFSTVPTNSSSKVPGIDSTMPMATSTLDFKSTPATHFVSSNIIVQTPSTVYSLTTSTSSKVSSSPASTQVSSSSVVPTMVPPTTVPLRERTCQDKPCNTGTCLDVPDSVGFNFTCVCPKPTYGPRCSTDYNLHFPRFGNGSYLVHKRIGIFIGFSKIAISFKTTAADGLLFYSTHRTQKDFIQLYVTDGFLMFRFNPGDGLVGIISNTKVNTGKLVTAVLTYDSSNRQGTLKVDNHEEKKRSSNGKSRGIGLYNYLYIGGLPPGKKIIVGNGGKETPTLDGCIKDMEINSKAIKFTSPDATDWHNLNECDKPCDHQPCHNNGNCTNDLEDPHDFHCQCPMGYAGKKCDSYRVCSGDPCKGGLCIANVADNSKKCLCPFGRAGISCENDVNITVSCFSMAYNYSSYIQYQTPKDSGPYFAISLQFRIDSTSSASKNSLLAYSGQEYFQAKGDDYIALGIINNQVVLEYDLGTGMARITSNNLDENIEWHSVVAGRDKQSGFLFVDNETPKRGSSPGAFSGLNLNGPLYIGGVPDFRDLGDIQFKSGFQGCLSNVEVRFGERKQFIELLTTQTGSNGWRVLGGRNVADRNYTGCDKNPCQNNGTCVSLGTSVSCTCIEGWKGMFCSSKTIPCVNHNPCASLSTCREVDNKAVCDCPLGKTGSTCSQSLSIQIPRFNENSFMSFDPAKLSSKSHLVKEKTNISITFTPSNASGLLFYVTFEITSHQRDFLSISLHNGYVHFRYDLGTGVANLQSRSPLSLNTPHTVEATRNGNSGTLKVDSEEVVSGQSPSTAVGLDVKSYFYLGGAPQLSAVNPQAVIDSSSLKDYVGCVASVTVNALSLDLTEKGAKEGRNIDNCPQSTNV